jgi:hypothetical protein
MEVYTRSEIFRRHTGNLDLIVNMYNDVQTSLLPVERPLIKNLLDRIDKTLSLGIGESKFLYIYMYVYIYNHIYAYIYIINIYVYAYILKDNNKGHKNLLQL